MDNFRAFLETTTDGIGFWLVVLAILVWFAGGAPLLERLP